MAETAGIAAWLDRAAADRRFAWLARGLDLTLRVELDGGGEALRVGGAPARLPCEARERADIVLAMTGEAWREIASPMPKPGFQSFGAWLRHDVGVSVAADPVVQAQALAALERLAELARPVSSEAHPGMGARDEEAVTGRRRRIVSASGEVPIHWLEAGDGPPLVFLHTAGADARQYRHQLADAELQARYRMLAFDMPLHGQSAGFDGCEDTTDYRLTETVYLDVCTAFIEATCAAPAIVVGCSMGAAMALTLTARRPDLVCGCIGLEAPFRAPGRRSDLLTDARIANGWHNPAYVRALLGPAAPQRFRDEACAIYAQARPGVYMGDLAYYSDEYDGALIAGGVREAGRPVALLTGSYDYSASPDNTRELVAAIGGKTVRFDEMEGLGHFPMIENPPAFRPHFLAALAHVEGASP